MADFTVKEWMDEESAEQQDRIAQDMAGSFDLGVLTYKELFQGFAPYLGEDATLIEAGKGLELLSKILIYLQTDLGRIDLHALVEYLCVRLENKDKIVSHAAGIRWVSKSLYTVAKMTARFTKSDASVVAKAVFTLASSSFREQLAATRLAVFELLNFLTETYSPAITRDMGAESFVSGLVDLAEFEKDPQCLTTLFQTYSEISQRWTLNSGSFKCMWDSFSRYFPITVKTTNELVPSREELQSLLVDCVASNDAYAAQALPYLFSGLDISEDTLSTYTKNTFLDSLRFCVDAYSAEIVAEWCPKIWDALKFEVWDGTNDEFIERALKVICAVGQKLDDGTLDWESLANPFAQYVISTSSECARRLHDSKRQHILGSGKILRAIASASPLGFNLVVRNVVPKMSVIWDDLSRDKKVHLLSVFNDVLQARLDLMVGLSGEILQGHEFTRYSPNSEAMLATVLANFQQTIVDDVFIPSMMEVDSGEPTVDGPYKINAIKGLVLGARIPAFLSDYHRETIILELSKLAVNQLQSKELHKELVAALQQISVEDATRFRDLTLATFLAELPNELPATNSHAADFMSQVIFILESLSQIACTALCKVELTVPSRQTVTTHKYRLFEAFQESLLKKFHAIIELPNQLSYANAILAAMYHGLQLFDEVLERENVVDLEPSSPTTTAPYTWIVMDLYQKLVRQKSYQGMHYMGLKVDLDQDATVNDTFFGLLGRLTTLTLRSSQTNSANNFLFNSEKEGEPSQIWNLFCLEQPATSITSSQHDLEDGPVEKCLMNVLSMSLVAGLRRDDKERLKIPIGITALSMIKNAISTKNDCTLSARISMLYFLQLLVNKFGAAKEEFGNEQRGLVQIMLDLVENCLTKTDELEIQNTYQTLAYFTAACLAIGDSAVKELISKMTVGISNELVGRKVAQSFRILLSPSEVMNEQNFCIIRKLRKQRLYQLCVEKLDEMWRGTQTKAQKENYLIALAGVLAHMELKILEDNAEMIFPIILEGTNVGDDFTMYTSISLIRALTPAHPEIALGHVDSIISRMTNRTHNTYNSPSDASVQCRTAALEVLTSLVNSIDRGVLLRRKAKIMAELDIALDDCSRTVRSAAERTKMRYFNLVEADA